MIRRMALIASVLKEFIGKVVEKQMKHKEKKWNVLANQKLDLLLECV